MRRFSSPALAGLALLALGSCKSPTELPTRDADADGFVMSVSGKSVHIRAVTEQCGIVLTMTDDTRILQMQTGGAIMPASMSDVTAGKRAQGWADGPIAESCPAQAKADVVVVN